MTVGPTRIASLLLCALPLLIAACGGDDTPTPETAPSDPPAETAPAAPEAAATPGFADTEWTLVALEPSGGAAVTPGADAVPTLQFNAKPSPDGVQRLIGFGGCNRFFGAYEAGDDGHLSLPAPLGSTRMACPEPIMGLETQLMQALASVSGYSQDGDELTITYAGGTLRFSGG